MKINKIFIDVDKVKYNIADIVIKDYLRSEDDSYRY